MIYLSIDKELDTVVIQDGLDGKPRHFIDFRTKDNLPERKLPVYTTKSIIENILRHGEVEFCYIGEGMNFVYNTGCNAEITLDDFGNGEIVLSTTRISDLDFESYSISLFEVNI